MRRTPLSIVGCGCIMVLTASCTAAPNVGHGSSTSQQGIPTKDMHGSTAEPDSLKQGGDLVFGLATNPGVVDPTFGGTQTGKQILFTMCESLYKYQDDGSVTPQLLAEGPKISGDERTYTFTLKRGLRFSDGEPVDADAIVKTFKRNLQEGSLRASDLGPVASVKAIGELRFRVELEQPYAPFLAALADRPGVPLSPKSFELGDTKPVSPVCVGPYRMSKKVGTSEVHLKRNKYYYNKDQQHLDTITFKVIPDPSVRLENLKNGTIQGAGRLSPQTMSSVSKDNSLTLLTATSPGFQGLYINTGNTRGVGKPYGTVDSVLARKPAVRRALNVAINRDALAKVAFRGWYPPTCGPIPSDGLFASKASRECPKYDPKKARAILKKAGLKLPVKLNLLVINTDDYTRYAEALQSNAAKAGFKLKIHTEEYTKAIADMESGDYEVALSGWFGRPDPGQSLGILFNSKGALNYTGYESPTMDKYLERAVQTNDMSARKEAYGKVSQQFQRDVPFVFLYRLRTIVGVTKTVDGAILDAMGVLHLGNAGFRK